jgi:predicted dehydrogenase
MKIGIIGAGRIAKFHCDAFRGAGAEIVAVATKSDSARNFAAVNNIQNFFSNVTQMLSEVKMDGVLVLSQPSSYLSILKELKPFNLPILIEKPLAYKVQEVEQLREYFPTLTLVGFNRRHYSNVLKVKEIIHGKKVLAQLTIPEREKDYKDQPLLSRENWPMMNGIHGIDLFCFLLGYPETIEHKKSWGDLSYSSIKRYYVTNFLTELGNRAIFLNNYDSPGGWRINIFFEKTEIIIAPFEKVQVKTLEGVVDLEMESCDVDFKAGFYRQAKIFLDGIKQNRIIEGWVDVDTAIKSMQAVTSIVD